MFHAIKNGDLKKVQRLVTQNPDILTSCPEIKYLPNLEVLAYIIEHINII
jgi:hypothetical protein